MAYFYDETLRRHIEVQVEDTGKKLLKRHSSKARLLALLEKTEHILAGVRQEPTQSTAQALFPVMTALIKDEYTKHADINIQVAVASCLNQIARITAPIHPYNDDLMKEIFNVFIIALKHCLTSESASNEFRAMQILEGLAIVRTCLMMTDIGIDAMIGDMFQFFFDIIKSDRTSDMFRFMHVIMTLMIDETEYVPQELLRPLLASVKMDNKNVSPYSWELGKTVFERSGTKLKPYLKAAVQSTDLNVDEYAEIIASLCQDTRGVDMVAEVVIAASSGDGVAQLDGIPVAEQEDHTPQGNNNAEIVQPETNIVERRSKRGRKPNSLMSPEEGYMHTWAKVVSHRRRHDNNNKKNLVLPLELGNSNMPSDSSQREFDSVNEGTFDKSSVGKNKESLMNLHNDQEQSSELWEVLKSKMVESPMSKLGKDKYPATLTPEEEVMPRGPQVDCYGEEMVNLRIIVWWPMDKTFYTGTVESFDPLTKKHKIKYDDDEEEILYLKEERWELFTENYPPPIQLSQKQEADKSFPVEEPVKSDRTSDMFTFMHVIITLMIDDIEEVPQELLRPLNTSVRTDNEIKRQRQ